MEFYQAALLQSPFQKLMKNLIKLKEMLNKYIQQLENVVQSAIVEHVDQFTQSEPIYRILEPQIQFNNLVSFMNKDSLFTQINQEIENSENDFTLLGNLQKNINELRNQLKQEFLTIFEKIKTATTYLSVCHKSNSIRIHGGIVEKVMNAEKNKNYSFQTIINLINNKQQAYVKIVKGQFSMFGLACPKSLDQCRYEYYRNRKSIIYGLSQTGYITSMINSVDGQEYDLKIREKDVVKMEYDKPNRKFKISNTRTKTEYCLNVMENHDSLGLALVVGLKNVGDQFVLL